jgi:general secretion pathway protein H
MKKSLNSNQGFTLIEIIIVLIIAVLGFSVIANNINSGNYGTKLQLITYEIASALRYAQSQALITQKSTSVDIDLSENSYAVSSQNKQHKFNNIR